MGVVPGAGPTGPEGCVLVLGSCVSLGGDGSWLLGVADVLGSTGTSVDVGVGVVGGAVEAGSAVEVESAELVSRTAVVVPVGPGPKTVRPFPGVRE